MPNDELLEAIALAQTNPSMALQKIKRIVEESPNSEEGWFAYGQTLCRLGKNLEGERALREALKCDDRQARTHSALAHLLMQQSRIGEAIASACMSVSLEPTDAAYRHFLGQLYATEG